MKRIIAVFLSLMLLLSLTTVAWAEETAPASHDHKGITGDWQPFPDTYNGGLWRNTGNYYLTEDTVLTSTLTVYDDFTLCLNGYALSLQEGISGNVIYGRGGFRITIVDCPNANADPHYFVEDETGLWTLTNISTDADQTIVGGVITGGDKSGIFCYNGNMDLSDITVAGNKDSGVRMQTGSLTMNNVDVYGNKGTRGGGILVDNGAITATISNCEVKGNSATDYGGGMFLRTQQGATITGGSYSDNTALYGGGIYVYDADTNATNITGIIVEDNKAELGGGLYLRRGKINVKECTISANAASKNGGGLYTENSFTDLTTDAACAITGNTAGSLGSGLYLHGGQAVLDGNLQDICLSNQQTQIPGTVTGSVTVANGTVNVKGTINGNIHMSGGNVDITTASVSVSGVVNVLGGSLDCDPTLPVKTDEIISTAFVNGDLLARSDTGEITVPAAELAKLAEGKRLLVSLNEEYSLAFDPTAAAQLKSAALKIEVEEIADTALTDAQRALLTGKNVKKLYRVTLTAGDPGEAVTDLGGGTLGVTVPYTKSAAGSTVAVYCLADAAEEAVSDCQDGALTAALPRPALFAVVERTSGGSTKPSTGGSSGSAAAVSSAETFDPGVALYAGLALMSAAGAAYVTGKRLR